MVNDIALPDKSSQSYEASLALRDYRLSHGVTFHPTQVNLPRLISQPDTLVLDLPTPGGRKAELT